MLSINHFFCPLSDSGGQNHQNYGEVSNFSMASQLVKGPRGPQEGPPQAMSHMVWTPDQSAYAWCGDSGSPHEAPCTRRGRACAMPFPLLDSEPLSASPGSATDLLWNLGLVPRPPCAWKMEIPGEPPDGAVVG